jgi:hypothetical protein
MCVHVLREHFRQLCAVFLLVALILLLRWNYHENFVRRPDVLVRLCTSTLLIWARVSRTFCRLHLFDWRTHYSQIILYMHRLTVWYRIVWIVCSFSSGQEIARFDGIRRFANALKKNLQLDRVWTENIAKNMWPNTWGEMLASQME